MKRSVTALLMFLLGYSLFGQGSAEGIQPQKSKKALALPSVPEESYPAPVGLKIGIDYDVKSVGCSVGAVFGYSNQPVNFSVDLGGAVGLSSEDASTTTPQSNAGFSSTIDKQNSHFYSVNLGSTVYFGKGDLKGGLGGRIGLVHWESGGSTTTYLGNNVFNGPIPDQTSQNSALEYTVFISSVFKGVELDTGINYTRNNISPYLSAKVMVGQPKGPEKR